MATPYSVNQRANSRMIPVLFLLTACLLGAGTGALVWLFSSDLVDALLTGGLAVLILGITGFLFYWLTKVAWLCHLQIIFHNAGALPPDFRFLDNASPWAVDRETEELVRMSVTAIQGMNKNLAANRHALDKYLGSNATKQVLRGGEDSKLGGQVERVFILFSDIRGFTHMAERLTAQATLRVLNQVFSSLATSIEEQGGEINKYIGDAILAYFKWPEGNEREEAVKVVKAAVEMQERFKMVAASNPDLKNRFVQIGLGIGIVAGKAIMGNLGSRNRMEFTLIGDSVNLASRICSIAPEGEILINEELAVLVSEKYMVESRLPVQLKGKSEKTTPYCVIGPLNP